MNCLHQGGNFMPNELFKLDTLSVVRCSDANELGHMAANAVAKDIRTLLTRKQEITMMFAAAPSQDTTLQSLINDQSIPWNRINAVHLDDYVGLTEDNPKSFRTYLRKHLIDHVDFKSVHLIRGESPDTQHEAERYADILVSFGIDIVLFGIGENGHIAFNDPPKARFNDSQLVKVVTMSEASRIQQVHDGCFATLDEVPKYAITVTIPGIMSGKFLHCVVPGVRKAEAVQNVLEKPISESCPASILRTHSQASLYIDSQSASLLKKDFKIK